MNKEAMTFKVEEYTITYYPELQPVVCNILKKAESKMLNGNLLIDEIK